MLIALVGAELEENLALRYIRSSLLAEGHRVFQVDFNSAADCEVAARTLAERAPAITGMSMVFTTKAKEFLALASRARTLGYAGHIIAGGHFAALNAEAVLHDAPAIDSVGLGEGEAIVCELARHLRSLDCVRGLVWRGSDQRIVRNTAPAEPGDLDRLPWPIRRCPPDNYLGLPIVNMLSSRGCSHACAFCSIAAWHRFCGGPRHRLRNVDDVADEMASLYRDGVRIFNFHDDNFLLRDRSSTLARIQALRDGLRARRVGRIAFAIKARPDEVDLELFSLLRDMGLFRVFLGIEAGTAASLRALGRGQTLSENERAIQVVAGLGLHMCFNLLLLNPDSTLEDMAANVAFLRRRPNNPMNFCRTEIYAGTPLLRKLSAEGRLLGDYLGYDYRIADPRAELACALTYDVFRPRNFGAGCLHHRTMDVDYENTLLNHFLASKHDVGLTAAIKDFVRRVNLNTCDYLDEVVGEAGAALDEPHYRRIVADLCRRMRTDETRLSVEADRLLDRIRARGTRLRLQRAPTLLLSRPRAIAAAAGLVATIASAGYVRGEHDQPKAASPSEPVLPEQRPAPTWHMAEMAPARPAPPARAPQNPSKGDGPEQNPTPEPPSHPYEMVPAPPMEPVPAAPGESTRDKAKESELRGKIAQKVLKTAVRFLSQAKPLELQLTLDKKGRPSSVVVAVPEKQAKQIADAVRKLAFPSPGKLAGQSIHLSFTLDEVRAQLESRAKRPGKRPQTYNHERTPDRPRSPSHFNEEAPF